MTPRSPSTELAELMCGRELTPPARPPGRPGAVLLRLQAITTAGSERRRLKDLSLSVHEGEILGIAGVAGNGQRELAEVHRRRADAAVRHASRSTARPSERLDPQARPGAAASAASPRIASADRAGHCSLPLADSMVLPRIGSAALQPPRPPDRGAIRAFAESRSRNMTSAAPGPLARTGTLSGGNLQKALLARELAFDPKVVIAAQPTRGLDIGAAQFVQSKFLELRAKGRGLIVISEDLEELLSSPTASP